MKRLACLAGIVLVTVISPSARGETTISADLDKLRNPSFWKRVNRSLEDGPVTVAIADGKHPAVPAVHIGKVGHAHHTLTIQPASPGKVIFIDAPGDATRNVLFELRDSQNVTLRDLTFTTPQWIGSALSIEDVQRVRVENCRFVDLPEAYYSAMTVAGSKTDDVIVRNCTFTRVGIDSHAHMIYGAYGVQRLSVVDCTFEDCSGEFVRFRDESDRGVVWGCTFKSTGTHRDAHPAMVSVPLFNDDNPASRPTRPNYEYFGTHFIFAHNRFEYDAGRGGEVKKDKRFAVSFLHYGYDPPGRRHLLSAAEAERLKAAAPDDRRAFLKERCGIELDQVHIFGNTFENVQHRLVFQTAAQYGAESRGFAGVVDLSDLINDKPVVRSADEAMAYLAALPPGTAKPRRR